MVDRHKSIEISYLNGGEADYLKNFLFHRTSADIIRQLEIDFHTQYLYTDFEDYPSSETLDFLFHSLIFNTYILNPHKRPNLHHRHHTQHNPIHR